jgi:hypothetical protein
MRPCPLTPNIKEMVEFLPVVHQQLESTHQGTKLSKNYLINKALMSVFGIPDIPINDGTAWGTASRPAGAEG